MSEKCTLASRRTFYRTISAWFPKIWHFGYHDDPIPTDFSAFFLYLSQKFSSSITNHHCSSHLIPAKSKILILILDSQKSHRQHCFQSPFMQFCSNPKIVPLYYEFCLILLLQTIVYIWLQRSVSHKYTAAVHSLQFSQIYTIC